MTPPEWTRLEPERIRILGELDKLRERTLAALPDCAQDGLPVLFGVLNTIVVCMAIVLGVKNATQKKETPWPEKLNPEGEGGEPGPPEGNPN